MYEPYDEKTASPEDRIAWAFCQIIDDDAPLQWTRYRFVAKYIADNKKLMADLVTLQDSDVSVKAKALVMGKDIIAGITDEDLFLVPLGIVLSFETKEDLRAALYGEKQVKIVVFEEEKKTKTTIPEGVDTVRNDVTGETINLCGEDNAE